MSPLIIAPIIITAIVMLIEVKSILKIVLFAFIVVVFYGMYVHDEGRKSTLKKAFAEAMVTKCPALSQFNIHQ